MKKQNERALVDLSTKTFLQVTALLFALMIAAIVLTYVIPKGTFGALPDGSPDYLAYTRLEGASGIPIHKGLLAPILVFFSDNGLTLIMLSLFLLVIFAAFQVMNDVGGIRALVGAVAERFKTRRKLLLAAITLVFMCFGAFLGQFEEMLTMLPIVTALCVLVGFDSFTGFLVSIIACGFGFASAITNPFTVLLASSIIGANPMEHILYRVLIFIVMYFLLLGFIFLYVRKLLKDPASSLTLAHDEKLRAARNEAEAEAGDAKAERRTKLTYVVFLLVCLAILITCSALSALRDYTVVVLIAYFLVFGILAGVISSGKFGQVMKSFLKGITGALPTILFIALASSIKYIFDEGSIMPTIVDQINNVVEGRNIFIIALVLYAIILVLEFFISSSTAKAILVMGMLTVVNVGLTKQMLVLIYTFADGYTNVLFPTSPVLLISLSMIEVDYFKWVKKSAPLFAANLALVILFIILGIVIKY
ncbi:MAG: hypothetical protein K6G56_01830 [Clostridiales bacterium]|nr:hypothetical protein [Clostridiales bacterium]